MKDLNWHIRYLDMAKLVSTWSKDPSSKFGSVIVDESNRVVSVGFNGFPKGFEDTSERLLNREFKYRHVLHSEENAILNARQSLVGCTIYVSGFPCSLCMSRIAQTGIKTVVHYAPSEDYMSRWSIDEPLRVAKECGITLIQIRSERRI